MEAVENHKRPAGPVVMRQQWRWLLFLHWQWEPGEIAATLPPGLEVDCYEGRAYLGVVPFFMQGVRPSFLPAVPGISNFLEMNLRTYVRDTCGRPGVWFYSLDCNQALAVTIARRLFHLPYEHARMRVEKNTDHRVAGYRCQRAGSEREAIFSYGPGDVPASRSGRGSLEEFLVERYRLFSYGRGVLRVGEVWHKPYEITSARVDEWSDLPITQAGFSPPGRPPEHAVYAPGVDVRIFPLRHWQALPTAN
jgi:uncharacterized protein YqjF (DUF2071 family)